MQCGRREGHLSGWVRCRRLGSEQHDDVEMVPLDGNLHEGEMGIDANAASLPHEVHVLPRRAEGAEIDAASVVVLA